KSYIKLYIDSVEQTDTNIDSISISKTRSSAHIATFDLGRPYDNTKPDMEAVVEIKYHIWTLFKGYITDISPSDTPESIRITAQNKHWKDNKSKKYFFVGHKPQDDKEKYYDTPKEAIYTEFSWDIDVGEFIPQTMSCFGLGSSDCVTVLIQNSGNYDWYYDVEENKKLVVDGEGPIVKLDRQELGKNLRLYDVIRHQFRESIDGIINKFRCQMGEDIIRRYDNTGGTKSYTGYNYSIYRGHAAPAWDYYLPLLAKYSSTGYAWDYPKTGEEYLYKDIFRKYYLPYLDEDVASWTDRWSPVVEIYKPGWWSTIFPYGRLTEGFTIDYENGLLIFDEPIYFYRTDSKGEIEAIAAPSVFVKIWKKNYYSYTASSVEDPESDVSNDMMFFVGPKGDWYDETGEVLVNTLDLPGLSKQEGATFINDNGEEEIVSSYDDIEFATDYANWQLSKTCDKKLDGSIDITLDAFCFYDINLSKRIQIDNVIDNIINIESITLNIRDFTATINLTKRNSYKRTVSMQSHGE
ncbi:MAG: hypothetical protein DRJ45_05455, partial [Thermoprotei archaeon]